MARNCRPGGSSPLPAGRKPCASATIPRARPSASGNSRSSNRSPRSTAPLETSAWTARRSSSTIPPSFATRVRTILRTCAAAWSARRTTSFTANRWPTTRSGSRRWRTTTAGRHSTRNRTAWPSSAGTIKWRPPLSVSSLISAVPWSTPTCSPLPRSAALRGAKMAPCTRPDKRYDGTTHLKNLFICGTDQGLVGIIGAILSGITVANAHLLK